MPWGAWRCRFLIREVGFSKGDAEAEAGTDVLKRRYRSQGTRAGTYQVARRWGVLGWHDGRGDSTNGVAAEDGKKPITGGGAHRDSTALWLTG